MDEDDVCMVTESPVWAGWMIRYQEALKLLNPVIRHPAGHKISRIKEIRKSTGLNLKQAKRLIEAIEATVPDHHEDELADLKAEVLNLKADRVVLTERYSENRDKLLAERDATRMIQNRLNEVKEELMLVRRLQDLTYERRLQMQFYLAGIRGMICELTPVEKNAIGCVLSMAEALTQD